MFEDFAPEFKNIKGWINSEPLTLRQLRGKVVLLDFWAYSCINCVRSLPHLKLLHEKYSDVGLVIIGMHTPEFEFERNLENVKEAVRKHGIKYPVALDSDNTTWHLYGNRYWPRQTIVDWRGKLRYEFIGEGKFAEIEEKLMELLKETGVIVERKIQKLNRDEKYGIYKHFSRISPETYLGSDRGHGFGNSQVCVPGSCVRFIDRGEHKPNTVYLDGDWVQEKERVKHFNDEEGHVAMKYNSAQVNVVMQPFSGGKFKVFVYLDGQPLVRTNAGRDIQFTRDGRSFVFVDRPDMYELVDTQNVETHDIKLVADSSEFTLYTFTFG